MPHPSFPGGTSSSPTSNNDQHTDDITNDGNMVDYIRRWEERNSEETHKVALAAARAHHDAVRERALGVLEMEQLREETEKLRQKRIQTEERVRLETERAMEELRIREEENKVRLIPKAPPRVPTPPPQVQQQAQAQQPSQQPSQTSITPASTISQVNESARAPNQTSTLNAFQSSQKQFSPPSTVQLNRQLTQTAHSSTIPKPAQVQSQISDQQSKQVPSTTAQPAQPPSNSSATPLAQGAQGAEQSAKTVPEVQAIVHSNAERYVTIHKTLKEVRRVIRDHGGSDPQFKKVAGEMRRAIIRSVGQLTEGKGVNKVQLQNICSQLDASLAMSVPQKLLINPAVVATISPRPSDEEVPNNGDHMPMLTIYLLNILAKGALSQFCSEAGANTKAADPIGTILVSVFAQLKYCWRGKSLIDILMAKFRVSCPVLFGIRGNEKTEEGRVKLGWKKDVNGNWISEQEHNDRMTGLGAGYASICLRDFSKTRLNNPWPAHQYWFALASITCTPPEDTSSTQFVVLKAMVDNYTTRFLHLFGDMGVLALHVALEEFPRKAANGNVAASSLQVVAAKLRKDTGLVLAVN